MRVFVAGATGAIGTRLVPQLIEHGHEVIGTYRSAGHAPPGPARPSSLMAAQLGPFWPSRRPPYRGRTVREVLEDIELRVDEPWCFVEGSGGPRRDAGPGRVPRPGAGRNRRRG